MYLLFGQWLVPSRNFGILVIAAVCENRAAFIEELSIAFGTSWSGASRPGIMAKMERSDACQRESCIGGTAALEYSNV